MKRIIFAGFLLIIFAFFYAFEEPSHLSFGAQQESSLEKNKYDSPHTTFNSSTVSWAKTYGGTGDDSCAEYLPIQETSDGGYIVLGTTQSFGPGGEDIWILKLDSSGGIEWQRTYGGGFMDYACSIQQTIDGGYIVAGYTESFDQQNRWLDASVLKLDSSGDIEWEETYGGSVDDLAWSIQQTSDGGYIVAGESYPFWDTGGDAFGVGGEDLLILKIDPNGDIPACGLQGSPTNSVNEPSCSPSNTGITPMNTDVIPQDTNITPQESDAIVYNVCPGPHTLTLSATTGGTTNPEPGTYTYDGGIYVTIEAIPDSGYIFTEWSGDASGRANPITIAMDSDKSITANFTKEGSDEEEKGNGDGCFIATVCFGTPMAEEVKTLCAFRDNYLATNPIGKTFVKFYYNHSPKVADFIRDKKYLKTIVRECLKPIFWMISKVVK